MKYLFSSLEEIKDLINQLGEGGKSIHELQNIDRDGEGWTAGGTGGRGVFPGGTSATDARAARQPMAAAHIPSDGFCMFNPTKGIYLSICCTLLCRLKKVNCFACSSIWLRLKLTLTEEHEKEEFETTRYSEDITSSHRWRLQHGGFILDTREVL